jgi:chromosome segregation ATPase
MADVAELIRRLEVLEQEGSAAAIERMGRRIDKVEQSLNAIRDKQEGHSTVLVKAVGFLEETRLRVSVVETRLERVEEKLDKAIADIAGLRKDLPAMLAEAVRAGKGGEEE